MALPTGIAVPERLVEVQVAENTRAMLDYKAVQAIVVREPEVDTHFTNGIRAGVILIYLDGKNDPIQATLTEQSRAQVEHLMRLINGETDG